MPTPRLEPTESVVIRQAEFQALLRDKVGWAVRLMLNRVLDQEVEVFLGAAPYERTPTRRDYRDGRYERSLVTGIALKAHGACRYDEVSQVIYWAAARHDIGLLSSA